MTSAGLLGALKLRYAAADPRSLGVFRVVLAAVMFADVLRRLPEVEVHFSNSGWLSNHFMLFRPMSDHLFSVYLAFSTPDEVRFLMLLHLVVCLLLAIGFHTRLMQVLAAVLIISLNSRNLMLENGGTVVLTLLAVWTVFLPLGERFSVDAVRRSLRLRFENGEAALNDTADPLRPTEPVVSLAVAALLLQWVAIYAFNVLQKTGPEWRDGTAAYYLLNQNSLLSGFGVWLRDHLSLSLIRLLTYGALAIEAAIALLLLLPVWQTKARLVAWGLAALLHLSIASIVDLGPFSWAMLAAFLVLLPGEAWSWLARRFSARYPESELCFDPESGFWISLARVVKRFDVLGHVRFVAVAPASEMAGARETEGESRDAGELGDGEQEADADGEEEDDDAEEDDDSEPEAARVAASGRRGKEVALAELVAENLVAVDPQSGERFLGVEGLLRLGRSIPGGLLLTALLRLPGVWGAVERRLMRAARDSRTYDEYFEVERLAHEPERRAAEPSPAALAARSGLSALREGAVFVLAVACGLQLLIENPGVPKALKPARPEWARALVVYPRLFQGWTMFAPSPPREDGRLVIDGHTRDGRRLDPLTGREPVFEVRPEGSRAMNQTWGELHRRLPTKAFEPYLDNFKDFIRRHHEVFERPEQALVSFQGWYVSQKIPAPGAAPEPVERRLLFSEGTPPPARVPAPGTR